MVVCMNTSIEPKLAPPGAGLPEIERRIGSILFAWRRWAGDRESHNARFQREREIIRSLISECDAESGAQRVLIKRLRGLEDSSRYWSVWMTLDHLRIIHQSLARVIGSLAKEIRPPGAASTAAVKPSPQATGAVVAEYEASCEALLATVAAADNLKTKARFAHPWFGPLDAAGWHSMAAGHIGIHRVQIERILEGLPGKSKRGGQ